MKELHPDALPVVPESVNEATYRRIEGTRRGPPVLLALADGEVWTTQELARFHVAPGKNRSTSTYQLLASYAKRGLVVAVEAGQERFMRTIKPKLPLFGRVTVGDLAAILSVAPSTVWKMRRQGRLPLPDAISQGHWSYWEAPALRKWFAAQGGFVRVYAYHCNAWQMTPAGLEWARGKRR